MLSERSRVQKLHRFPTVTHYQHTVQDRGGQGTHRLRAFGRGRPVAQYSVQLDAPELAGQLLSVRLGDDWPPGGLFDKGGHLGHPGVDAVKPSG